MLGSIVSHVFERVNTLLLILLVLICGALVAMMATRAHGGPLDPPAAPGSTYATLSELRTRWDQALSSTDGSDSCHSSRFTCVMDLNVVLDNETGLVWNGNAGGVLQTDWWNAAQACYHAQFGGRYGWRLPTVEELMTLYDGTQTNPAASLPAGNPFFGTVDPDGYWTSTTFPFDSTAYYVDFVGAAAGQAGSGPNTAQKDMPSLYRAWCVRGGQGSDSGQ